MKLLLIDYLSPQGHIKFDRIHIKSLQKGNVLDVVGKKGHFKDFENTLDVNIGNIPDSLFTKLPFKPFTERLLGLLRLLWICRHYNTKCYDAVIFLSYDILSFFIYRKRGKVFLINHNNVSQLNNRVKLHLTRQLPQNYLHVALNQHAETEMKRLLSDKIIEFVPHGYEKNSISRIKPDFIKDGERFIFCPVNRNYDKELINRLFKVTQVHDYLVNNGITLYHKIKGIDDVGCENIKRLDSFLKAEEYSYMLTRAMAVLLPYGEEFKYRCSGIFFECVAEKVSVIAPPIPDLTIYREIANVFFFDDADSFIKCITEIPACCKSYDNEELLNPQGYWNRLLNS